jgi:bifunctional N-acetylglucosamine-1-phosphate-uridyltransferase/glucosamine-1-phosphate-acetyltransferase GlmU-like protein
LNKNTKSITSIILAAGKGTRMNTPDIHKVCHDLNGLPVIGQMLKTFRHGGIENNVLVVGQMVEQVMQTVSQFDDNAIFTFQKEQHGTGNAAKQGARLLKSLNYNDYILIAAGDKVFDPDFLQSFIKSFLENPCDLQFITGPVSDYPTSGRVIFSDTDQPLGIIEVFDIAKFKILRELSLLLDSGPVDSSKVREIIQGQLSEKKAVKAFGAFLNILKANDVLTRAEFDKHFSKESIDLYLNGDKISNNQLDSTKQANLSVYILKAKALYEAIEKLNSDNAQNEEYLTDIVEILASQNAYIRTMPVSSVSQVMAFNTPEELEFIKRNFS